MTGLLPTAPRRPARQRPRVTGWVLMDGPEQMSRRYQTRGEALRWLALLRTWHPAAVLVRA